MRAGAVVAAALLGLLAAGCSGGDDEAVDEPFHTGSYDPTPAPGTSPTPQPTEPGRLPGVPQEDPPPCAEVRAGIDAFNIGDPEETVERFEAALPLAEEYAADPALSPADAEVAGLLLEAVAYYAALPPEDYTEALRTSREFARHQAVTLTVCRYGLGPGLPDSPGATEEPVPA